MEQTFGHEGNLADAGWQPLPEPPKDEEKIYNGDSAGGVREAANDLAAQRAERMNEPGYKAHDPEATIPRPYIYRGGEHDGEPVEKRLAVTIDRAAHDLSEQRKAEADGAQRQIAEVLTPQVDAYRAAAAGQPLPDAQPQQQPSAETNAAPIEQQPQPEAPPDSGIDHELAQALQNPKVRMLLEHEAAQAQQLQQSYADATRQATEVAAASVYAAYPELQGLAGEQLAGAIHAIGRQNPQRATEIRNHIERVRQHLNISQAAQVQQQQRAAAQFQEYARNQDAVFDAVMAKEAPESVRQIQAAVPKVVKERYGMSEQELLNLWRTQPLLRSAPFSS